MKALRFYTAGAVILGFCMLPLLQGCGGASEKPTITVKPSKSEGGGGTSTGNGGAAKGATEVKGFGTLTGKVVFQGTPPELSPLHLQGAQVRDPAVCAASDMPNERLVVDPGGGVANVFVYLQRAPAGAPQNGPPEEPVIFDQENCRFTPHALTVQVGQTLRILSSDPIAHNTHIFGGRNTDFNEVIAAGNQQGFEHTFQIAELNPIEVKCDFHNWMSAYHLPLDHPYAAVTGEDGSFTIDNIPAGTHSFRVWHEAATGGYLDRSLSVAINPDQTTNVEIPYPADKLTVHGRPAVKRVKLSSLLKQ